MKKIILKLAALVLAFPLSCGEVFLNSANAIYNTMDNKSIYKTKRNFSLYPPKTIVLKTCGVVFDRQNFLLNEKRFQNEIFFFEPLKKQNEDLHKYIEDKKYKKQAYCFGGFCGICDADFYPRGWKIHISPKPNKNIFKILEIVENAHNKLNFCYKFFSDLELYVNVCNKNRNQAGKFITIYPINDNMAFKIAETINDEFKKNNLNENDFLEIKNDFKIYPGIYTRLCHFNDIEDKGSRYHLSIPQTVFKNHVNSQKMMSKYKHPFNKLTVKNIEIPKKVSKINKFLSEKFGIN